MFMKSLTANVFSSTNHIPVGVDQSRPYSSLHFTGHSDFNRRYKYCNSILVRYINEEKFRVVEGEYRFKELAKFIEDHKTIKSIWLSEDATAVISKIKYDPATNQLVGILLPTNTSNGSPIPFR